MIGKFRIFGNYVQIENRSKIPVNQKKMEKIGNKNEIKIMIYNV